jgi:hypothetical protein
MEHVAEETLDHLIGKKGLGIRETIPIADALAAGIVHRDLKPQT